MAGRPCSVCTHPDAPAIDQAMVNHKPFRAIARQFGVSKDAVLRHHDDDLPEALTRAKAASDTVQADDLLAQLRALRSKAMSLLLAAERAGDIRTALAGVREARATLELLLEVEQRIDRRPTLSLLVAPEWLHTRSALLDALRPFPEARTAVAARLAALAMALDPVALSRAAGIVPDDWQAGILRSTAPRTLLNASRQSGKSTTTGTLAVHEAIYRPGSLTLMLSPGLRQSGELFRKAVHVYRTMGRPVPA